MWRRTASPRTIPAAISAPATNGRGGGGIPLTTGTHVFDNDFPALRAAGPPPSGQAAGTGDTPDELLAAEPESGICRVICFSPRHDLTLADMDMAGVREVVDVWAAQYEELGSREDIGYVQIFENKGEMMGDRSAPATPKRSGRSR